MKTKLIPILISLFALLSIGLRASAHELVITNAIPKAQATDVPREHTGKVVWATVVMDMVREAGVDTAKASKIIECESTWNPNAVNLNRNGSNDMGLWQINSIHGLSDEVRKDPIKSTEFAIYLINKNGFKPWTCR